MKDEVKDNSVPEDEPSASETLSLLNGTHYLFRGQHIQNMIDLIREGIIFVDETGNQMYANKAFCAMTGYSIEALKRMNVYLIVDSASHQIFDIQFKEQTKEISRSSGPELSEKSLPQFPVKLVTTPIISDNGLFRGIYPVVADTVKSGKTRTNRPQKKNYLNAIFDISNTGFVIFNNQLQILETNPAFKSLWPHEAVKLDKKENKVHPLLNHPLVCKAIKEYKNYSYILEIESGVISNEDKSINNDSKILEINIIPLHFESETSIFLAQVEDITQKQKITESLKKSEEHYRSLTESAKDLIFIIADTGQILYANNFCLEYFSSLTDNFVGLNLTDLLPSHLSENYLKQIRDVIKTNASVKMEERFSISEREVWLDINLIPLQSIGGKAHGVLGMGRDITDRKEIEEKLRQSEELLNLALDSSNSVAWSVNLETNALKISKQMGQLTGFEPGTDGYTLDFWYQIMHPKDLISFKQEVRNYIQGKIPDLNIEYRLIHKKGDVRWMLMKGNRTRSDSNGKPIEISGITFDITLIKELQAQLKEWNKTLEQKVELGIRENRMQLQQLIQKSKLEFLGEMAAGIIHEINQPLGLLNLQLDFLNDILHDDSPDLTTAYNKIESCFEQISRISFILKQIGGFSRQKSEHLIESLDINLIIENMLILINPQFARDNIALVVNLEMGLPKVKGIGHQIEMVIFNLISNARFAIEAKADRSGSSYQKKISISTIAENQNVHIVVEDNGTGIPEKNFDKIFKPFFTTKPEGKGTGLGLPICYSIINGMQGDIKVKSSMGEYTQMIITLPAFL